MSKNGREATLQQGGCYLVWAILSALTGGLLAFALLETGKYLLHLKYVYFSGLVHRAVLVLCLSSLALVFWRKARRAGAVLLAFLLGFLVSSFALRTLVTRSYCQSEMGRLAYSAQGVRSLDDWLDELNKCLIAVDSRSTLKIEDFRNNGSDESIRFSWQAHQTAKEVLKRLSEKTSCAVAIDIQGNPWCRGPVCGELVLVTLRDSTDKDALRRQKDDEQEQVEDPFADAR